MQDDLLDSYGDEELGKAIGGDILEGKKTYLMVTAMSRADESTREVLRRTYRDERLTNAEKIAAVMARSGSRGVGRTLAREEAAALLAQLADTGNFSFSPSGKAITAEITPEDLRAKLG